MPRPRPSSLSPRAVIAVDGPAGAGKSSAAQGLARTLGFRHVDTGAMYRAAAWAALRTGTPLDSSAALTRLLQKTRFDFSDGRVRVDGRDVAEDIRSPAVSRAASRVAAQPPVRRRLVQIQRDMARGGGVVMEGRDVGTVVFPRAAVKFFLDASPEERARRRWREWWAGGRKPSLDAVARAIRARDERDRTRPVSPLRAAADAVVVDTTGVPLAEVQRILADHVRKGARP